MQIVFLLYCLTYTIETTYKHTADKKTDDHL